MKKQILSFFCGALVALTITMVPAVADSISKKIDVLVDYVTVTLDGKEVDVKNFVHEGTTYLGLRDMGNLLGLQVDWHEKTRTAVLTSPGKTPVFPREENMQTIEIPIAKPSTITVNGTVVDSAWITQRYNMYKNYYPNADAESIKQAVKDDAAWKVFQDNCCEKYGIEVTEEDKQAAEKSFIEYADQYGGIEALNLALASNNINPDDHKKEFIESYLNNTIITNKITDALVDNTDELSALKKEKEDEFNNNKSLREATTATVKHILIPQGENAEAEAKKVLSRLKKGEKFDKLLAEFNNDPGMPEEGYEVSIGSGFVPEFEEASVKLQKGKYSDLVETSYGYHIIYCLDTKVNPVEFKDYFYKNFNEEIYSALDKLYTEWVEKAEIKAEWGF